MIEASQDRLYRLLPSLYRQRDAAVGEPLRALLSVFDRELDLLESDIEGLYENWFIETCDEWAVAYLGDLLGGSQLGDEQHLTFSQRARVANTIAHRRRKGTVGALEGIVRDATGWRALAVPFFEHVATTQHVQHVRRERGATIDLRRREAVERIGEPFDALARRVDVRRIATGRGTHNVPSVGVCVWRIAEYSLSNAATPVVGEPAGRFMFDVLGRDLQLFTKPTSPRDSHLRLPETALPVPLNRRTFAADLAANTARHVDRGADRRPVETGLYGLERSVAVVSDGVLVSASRVASADLGEWTRPSSGVAIDVERGRIAFAPGEEPSTGVVVAYHYGFSTDLGGGPYDRRASVVAASPLTFHAQVASTPVGATSQSSPFTTLRDAVAAWRSSGRAGLIDILDSEAYDLDTLDMSAGHELRIQAVDGARPAIRGGAVSVQGRSRARGVGPPALSLDGCLLGGPLRIAGSLNLRLAHCSLPSGLESPGENDDVRLTLVRSIVGAVRGTPAGTTVVLHECIADGPLTASVLSTERTTVLGRVRVRELSLASETIFAEPVTVERRQRGAVRFCYVPVTSITPQRFRCQPDLALMGADAAARPRIVRRVLPTFTSVRYGDPGFAQLDPRCAIEVSTGAEDGSEMGVFHHLHQPQRAAVLRALVEEYLPLGLEAGVRYVS